MPEYKVERDRAYVVGGVAMVFARLCIVGADTKDERSREHQGQETQSPRHVHSVHNNLLVQNRLARFEFSGYGPTRALVIAPYVQCC